MHDPMGRLDMLGMTVILRGPHDGGQVAPRRPRRPDCHRGPATRHPEWLGRRDTTAGPVWISRRLLLTGTDHLTGRQWARLNATLAVGDLTAEIGAPWGVKERLRRLLGESEPSKIRWRLANLYDEAIDADTPEITWLANTGPNLVAVHPGRPHRARVERPHRRVQPNDQTNKTGRLRPPKPDQLPASYPVSHRGHLTAENSSMNAATPLKFAEPLHPGL